MSSPNFNQVVDAIRKAKTPGQKAAATKLKQKYVEERSDLGKDPKWVEAGIKARITRYANA